MREPKCYQNAPLWREIHALRGQKVAELKNKYLCVFGRESQSNNKPFLVRRIAWRLQAEAEGSLSERARQRAVALAEESDLRIRAPETFLKRLSGEVGKKAADPRLPPAGTILTRQFRGQSIVVEVLENGFRYQEQVYKSLSAVARQVSGVQWNGFSFFALPGKAEREHE
ncbi:MAG: DUF2924 domain-containing protein [Bryobacteraceae bacterium]